MDKTLALTQVLDAQLTILNIEGLRSEHRIYTDVETYTEYKEILCSKCGGSGEVEIDDEHEPGWCDLFICPECDGAGHIEIGHEITVPYEESWMESNIII